MFAALVLAALAAAPAFPADGSYSYAASLNGVGLGRWAVEVKRTDSQTELDENSAASLNGMQLVAKATLLLGADLSPQKYDGSYRVLGQNPSVSVSLTPAAATVTGAQTAAPLTLPLGPNTRHFVVVEQGLLAGLFAVPAQLAAWKESTLTWISPMTGQAKPIGASPSNDPRPANVPPNDVELSLSGDVPVTMWYDPVSLVPDRIAVPSENAVLTRVR